MMFHMTFQWGAEVDLSVAARGAEPQKVDPRDAIGERAIEPR